VGPSSKASAKPPSRSTTRTSSRQHRALDEVAELEEEEEPEKKKSRKSVEGEDDEIVELPKPRRGRGKKVVQDDGEVQEVKPSRRSSARPRTTRLRDTARVEASEDEESKAIIVVSDDDEEVKLNRKSSTKTRSTRPHKTPKVEVLRNEESKGLVSISEDDEEWVKETNLENGSFDPEVTPKPLKSSRAALRRLPSVAAEDDTDDLDGFQEEFQQTPRRVPRKSQSSLTTPKSLPPPFEEEEEMSLLEPRVKPTLAMQLPPPEEPSGPKSRLVIHKMVLVNFKSYAGRQEIGPFHKVWLTMYSKQTYYYD